ncbi:MAG: ABC transporter ATP-binding protein [Bacteroidota bacterium]
MSQVSGRAFDVGILSGVFRFVKPYRKTLWATVLLTIAIAAMSPLRPYLTQHTLDSYVAQGDLDGLVTMTMVMLAVLVIQSLFQFLHAYQSNLLGQLVIRDMRVQLLGKMIRFPVPYFDRTSVGIPVTRTISDMETVADIFSDGLIIIIGDLLQLAVIMGYMFYVDWQLTLVSLSTIPLLAVATNVFKNSVKKSFTEVRTQVAALNTFVNEHLSGIRVVQMNNREVKELERFKEINSLHRDANIRSVWYYSIFFPVVEILSAISIGLLVWWGASEVISDRLTFGTLVAFIMYINMLFRPIRELADKFNTLQMGVVSSERILKLMDNHAIEGATTSNNQNLHKINQGIVEFKNVWFAYKDEDWVLKDVSFKIEKGSRMALVGATGSGKTTIISLINRFYEIQKGAILIDGVDIRDFRLDELRASIAVVLQDVFLFSDTIRNNVTLGDESIGQEKIREGAKRIGLDRLIQSLPNGLDYRVGERGTLLSMGQRQLISFLRAWVHDPAILVLDEATSSIDSESEHLIINATEELTKGRTSIVIAHRLATIRHANCILVLDKGSLVEQGSHQELLAKKGFYHRLYEVQFSHQDD